MQKVVGSNPISRFLLCLRTSETDVSGHRRHAGLALAQRHPQGVEHQVGAHVGSRPGRPTTLREKASITKEKNRAPLPGAQVGEVAEPIQRLIRERVPVDAAALGDPEVLLEDL
jgi:hypothetical protein